APSGAANFRPHRRSEPVSIYPTPCGAPEPEPGRVPAPLLRAIPSQIPLGSSRVTTRPASRPAVMLDLLHGPASPEEINSHIVLLSHNPFQRSPPGRRRSMPLIQPISSRPPHGPWHRIQPVNNSERRIREDARDSGPVLQVLLQLAEPIAPT